MQVSEIKNYLKKKKITYEELSKTSQIPIGTLKSIFSGRTPNPRLDTMQAIEEALGISKPLEWTDEEKALGVGNHPTNLSDKEWQWQELRSELIRVHGEKYYETVFKMVEALLNIDKK